METDYAPRRATFRQLHESGCFLIPNPWDAGSARFLASIGFPALATTSGGLAFSRGLPDASWAVDRDAVLANVREIVAATPLPVSADFESGYAADPEGVAANVRLCAETGAAGLSIEDASGDRERPLYDLPLAVERIRAAHKALEGTGILLTARAECFLSGHPEPLREALTRLEAFAAAGADVLFAPGVSNPEDIRALVRAVSPKPFNLIMTRNLGISVADIAALGVRRVSVGSALARSAWAGFQRAAREIAEQGTFTSFETAIPFPEINGFFKSLYRPTK